MSVFWDRKDELEKYEFMMGIVGGRMAVSLDVLTDSLALIGQHSVYCASTRNPAVPALDLQTVMRGITDAKELIGSAMEELRKSKLSAAAGTSPPIPSILPTSNTHADPSASLRDDKRPG